MERFAFRVVNDILTRASDVRDVYRILGVVSSGRRRRKSNHAHDWKALVPRMATALDPNTNKYGLTIRHSISAVVCEALSLSPAPAYSSLAGQTFAAK